MSAFDAFDDIWCIHNPTEQARWPKMQARFHRLGIAPRVRQFTAIPSPADLRIGRALSHRKLIQDAAERGLRSILVIEDQTLFLDTAEQILAAAIAELRSRPWAILHLGAARGAQGLDPEPGLDHLRPARGRVGPHAVAYARPAYDALLTAMPMSFNAMETALGKDRAIDTILAKSTPAFITHPAIATLPFSLPYQIPEHQERFVA